MRRNRNLREYRDKMIKRAGSVSDKRKRAMDRLQKSKNKTQKKDNVDLQYEMYQRRMAATKKRQKTKPKEVNDHKKYIHLPSFVKSDFSFIETSDYIPKSSYRVVHYMDSLGLGGAQTMTMELYNSLNKYYPDNTTNYFISHDKLGGARELFKSYNVDPITVPTNQLKSFCEKKKIDIFVHHRTAYSRCMKNKLPKDVSYVLVNHTFNNMNRMRDFLHCDYFVSVCNFLKNKTIWPDYVESSRRLVILNGVENDYISGIDKADLQGKFITGRCHRMVGSKFRNDSLNWLAKHSKGELKGSSHYLIGESKDAKIICDRHKSLHYKGSIKDRTKKMSMIKAFDVYFYETFRDEGASMAVLESLASGVPVLCKAKGGNNELITNGVNGYIVGDRSEFLLRLKQMYMAPAYLDKIKKTTLKDFNERLHIKHTANRYMQLFEQCRKEK